MRRAFIALATASAFLLMTAGAVWADSTDTHTFRWDRTHAVRTSVWYDNDTWADTDGNGWDDTLTYTVYFRVRNIDSRRVQGSAVVKSVVDGLGGPDETRHSETFTFSVAPGQTSPTQTYVMGPVRVNESDDTTYSDDWVASATWHGIRIRG